MSIIERIHALRGASKLHIDTALERAEDAYNAARERARYARDDVHASEANDRELGLLQTSAATDRAQEVLDRAESEMHVAWAVLDAERKRFGKVFLRELDSTAAEVADITLALSNAVQALQGHAYVVAQHAARHHLPVHRSIDHAASLDSVVRKLRFLEH